MMASSIGMAQQKIAGLNIWLLLPERLNGSKLWRRKTISSYKNKEAMRMKKQTAGSERLGDFAPQFAALNDDVLFGEVWSREQELSARDRSLITVASLLTQGVPQLEAHLRIAKENGVTQAEIVELITHLAFYAGWPKAWSAFNLAKEIYAEE
ncbi:carboxymuconolactone decarboxylase [Enterococcus gallinarum EG2]|nr:carboxymuconolactone decarboxylase [Enterococcus gallinarum EG2]